ncbi:hypothetical protein GYA19_04600 [Candidatus Beckwithbacteria bacterium]|nr:hypothetical protein [Candidatus Beckwithbacteria bacterium]
MGISICESCPRAKRLLDQGSTSGEILNYAGMEDLTFAQRAAVIGGQLTFEQAAQIIFNKFHIDTSGKETRSRVVYDVTGEKAA